MKIGIQHTLDEAIAAFGKAQRQIAPELERLVQRGAQEIAREARRGAPKADSTLTNAIRAQRAGALEWMVGAGVEHGAYVELGTGIYGPGRTPSGKMPPLDSLVDWIRRVRIEPRDPDMDERDLAYVIGRSIARTGTPRQPYLEPALDAKRGRLRTMVREAVARGLGELGQ